MSLATVLSDEYIRDNVNQRPSLTDLAALGTDALAASLHNALPGAENEVAVAAFNSSI